MLLPQDSIYSTYGVNTLCTPYHSIYENRLAIGNIALSIWDPYRPYKPTTVKPTKHT